MWKKDLWIPPQYPGVEDDKYKKYTSMLRESNKHINESFGDVPTFAHHNKFVAYVHLKVPNDTLSKYLHESINFNPVCQCNKLNGIIRDWKFDTILPKSFRYEWKCALERCTEIYARFNQPLIRTLSQIKKDDQEIRERLDRLGNAQFEDGPWVRQQWAEQTVRDSINLIKIDTIIRKWGYPGRSLVGDELSDVAFYVIQHAPAERLTNYLSVVRNAAVEKEISCELYGYLLDRDLMFRNKKQIFGTQTKYNPKKKKLELFPVENPENIDDLRSKMGMIKLDKYLKDLGVK
jgi:hypothetical protein